MNEKVDWSELPTELWPKIGKFLDNRIDVLRFRSVCVTWRSSIPPSPQISALFPLQTVHPIDPSIQRNINRATIYIIEPSDASSNSKLEPLSPSSSSSSSKGWLVKVEGSSKGPLLRLLSPISDRKIPYPVGNSPLFWDLLEYKVIDVCKSYTIQNTDGIPAYVNKVVCFPYPSRWVGVDDYVACCVFLNGKLGVMKHGGQCWTLVDYKNIYYDDVIVHKDKFYVTDRWGTISWIDTFSLKLVQISPPLCGSGNKKHLVESCGSLFIVDRFYETEPRARNSSECFKVHKLDEELGTWVDVKNLEDRAFILGNTCNFSVSAKGLIGYHENCIYFTGMFDVRMYNLDDHSILTIKFYPCIEKDVLPQAQSSWI